MMQYPPTTFEENGPQARPGHIKGLNRVFEHVSPGHWDQSQRIPSAIEHECNVTR